MFGLFRRKRWPTLSFEEIKKRTKIVVIDDDPFPYKTLFKRDGYNIDKWNDINDLPKLKSAYYDIILLDIQGVGREHSKEQGLGILKHLKESNPSQIIVAYSNADWSLHYQEFFRMADAVLAKNADYVDFEKIVHDLLAKRFTLGFYLDKVVSAVKEEVDDPQHVRALAEKAIYSRSTSKIEEYLKANVRNTETVANVVSIINSVTSIVATIVK